MISLPPPPLIVSIVASPDKESLPAPPLIVTAAVVLEFAEANVTARFAAESVVAATKVLAVVEFPTTPEASKLVIATLPVLDRLRPLLPVTTKEVAVVAARINW